MPQGVRVRVSLGLQIKNKTMNRVVISLIDIENSSVQVVLYQSILEQARNKLITFVPLIMEHYNQVYYRDANLETFISRRYTGMTDDRRAINAFIGSCFDWLNPVLPGKSEVIIHYSESYKTQALILKALIKGLELHQRVQMTQDFITFED